MRPRALAAIIPAALLVAACSTAAAPTSTSSPSPSAAAGRSATPASAPSIVPSDPPTGVPAGEGSPEPQSGEVKVSMSDAMRFAPDPIRVKAGAEITFVVTNDGAAVHEFFVGTEAEQVGHAAEMAAGGMSHGHENALSLKPGESGSLTKTFARPGSLLIGCHEPGHYQAGMKATLQVVE